MKRVQESGGMDDQTFTPEVGKIEMDYNPASEQITGRVSNSASLYSEGSDTTLYDNGQVKWTGQLPRDSSVLPKESYKAKRITLSAKQKSKVRNKFREKLQAISEKSYRREVQMLKGEKELRMGKQRKVVREKKKNIDSLYKNIFSIKESLQDATTVALETANMAAEFGGEISRVITSQINEHLIPAISKFIEDAATPGAVAPLITFLDSVPLSMTRQEPATELISPSSTAAPADPYQSEQTPTLEGAAISEGESGRARAGKAIANALARANGMDLVDDEEADETFEDRNQKADLDLESNKTLVNMHRNRVAKQEGKYNVSESKAKLAEMNALLRELETVDWDDISPKNHNATAKLKKKIQKLERNALHEELDEEDVEEVADEANVDEEEAADAITKEKAKASLEE